MATIILGVLADSYRRQFRKVQGRPIIDVVLDKMAVLIEEFHLGPIGLDFSVSQLASTDQAYLEQLRAKLQEMRIVPTVIIGSLLLHADRDLWQPALDKCLRALEVAHILGSRLGLYYFNYGGRVTREGRLRLAVEQVRQLADAASCYGITVTTENYDFFTSDDFLRLFEGVNRSNVGLHDDTGNWLILGEDPLEATRKLAPYIYHAHVRDYTLRDGVFTSVPLGRGLVELPPLLDELRSIGARRESFILSVEMDLDEGDAEVEDYAVRECLRYMVNWASEHLWR